MLTSYRDYVFHDIYRFAAIVDGCVDDSMSFLELGLERNEMLLRRLLKPHQVSILHQYIFATISTWQRIDYRRNEDSYDDVEAMRLMRVFGEYGIPLTQYPGVAQEEGDATSQGIVDIQNDNDEPDEDFLRWYQENEASFEEYWTQVTDEVFHVVFENRHFLQRFGSSLAEYLLSDLSDDPIAQPLLGRRIERVNRYPSWLKKAVFHRDKGRCVFCMVDLSNLIAADRRLHLDHIVALSNGGTNDPSNFQLLCEQCNLKKADGPARGGRLYIPFW